MALGGALGGAAAGAGAGALIGGIPTLGIGAPVGAAIGGTIGAVTGNAFGTRTGNLTKKYIRSQLANIHKGPDDARAAAEQAQMGAVSDQVIGAQQQVINQAAMNQGPIQAGALRSSAQDLGKAGQDAAVKQTSEANRLKKAMQAQKVARIENLAFKGADIARQDAQAGTDAAMAALSTIPMPG